MSHWSAADDELMWLVAESGDDQAVQELVSRRPDLRSEVLRRASMIAELRRSRPEIGDFQRVPAFTSDVPAWRSRPKWGRLLLLGLPAFAIAATLVVGPKILGRTEGETTDSSVASTGGLSPEAVKGLPPNPYEPLILEDGKTGEATAGPDDVPPIGAVREPKITLHAERITLAEALQKIAAQAGLQLEVAPGLPDFEITAHYANVSAREALEDLGKNFGFTVFDQGDRSLLIIPAVDRSADR
jgi:hypothetical protein